MMEAMVVLTTLDSSITEIIIIIKINMGTIMIIRVIVVAITTTTPMVKDSNQIDIINVVTIIIIKIMMVVIKVVISSIIKTTNSIIIKTITIMAEVVCLLCPCLIRML